MLLVMKMDRYVMMAVLAIVSTPVLLQARTWTEATTGRTLEGDFVEMKGDNAVIKRDNGATVNVALSRLSEADRKFIQSQVTKPAGPATRGGGTVAKLIPPVTVKCHPVTGKGDDRESSIEVTNTGDRKIKRIIIRIHFLKPDGSVGKVHLGSHQGEGKNMVGKGKSETIDVTSFFMEDDTAGIDATVKRIIFEDDSEWPSLPAAPPAPDDEVPASAMVIGVIGEADRAVPVVACYNHSDKGVKRVQYRITYLDEQGKEVGRTSYGYGGPEPIMAAGEGFKVIGGDGPPEEAVAAEAHITSLRFADDSAWKAPN